MLSHTELVMTAANRSHTVDAGSESKVCVTMQAHVVSLPACKHTT